MVTFWEAIGLAYRQMFNYFGVATRSEFWWFTLYQFTITIFLTLTTAVFPPAGFILLGVLLFNMLASTALSFRRIRDAFGSAWLIGVYWITAFVPALALGPMLYEVAMSSQTMSEAQLERFVMEEVMNSPYWSIAAVASVLNSILAIVVLVGFFLPSKKYRGL